MQEKLKKVGEYLKLVCESDEVADAKRIINVEILDIKVQLTDSLSKSTDVKGANNEMHIPPLVEKI